MNLELTGVLAEHLRGYTKTYLPLDRDATVIVGRNNSGKTSLLRLLDWLLNEVDAAVLAEAWTLPASVAEFLLPARDSQNSARRLTLRVHVRDRRSHRRFECRQGIALLRLNIRLTPGPVAYLALGQPRRGEVARSSPLALELLERVKQSVRLVYVPSFRDAASTRFRRILHGSLSTRVQSRTIHRTQGGAPAEYRAVKSALASIRDVVESLAAPLWTSMRGYLPPGLAREGKVTLDCDIHELVAFAVDKLGIRVSTGSHDDKTVLLTELGSGLQSLLELSVHASEVGDTGRTMLVIEEPESFLHPSAQRLVTRLLLSGRLAKRLLVTTHSSVVVDEARYGEVVICRGQKFYYPRQRTDLERDEINSALLSGQGAEMLFSRSVLLVEGESDRLFFEKLRRRLAQVDGSGAADELFVVAVGGKTSFAPWIRLLESYGTPADRPIEWLVVADGDAGADVRRALADAQVTVAQDVLDQMTVVGASIGSGYAPWAESVRELNRRLAGSSVRAFLLPVDLESAALSGVSQDTRALIGAKMGLTSAPSHDELLKRLGSKAAFGGQAGVKAPWLRGFIGAHLPWGELSPDVRQVLVRWLSPVLNRSAAKRLLASPELSAELDPLGVR